MNKNLSVLHGRLCTLTKNGREFGFGYTVEQCLQMAATESECALIKLDKAEKA